MAKRIPLDAFEYYVSLGAGRSYKAVAEHYGVSKPAVTKHASQHHWSERLAEINRKVRENSDQKLQETMEQLNERHLRMLKVVEAKSLEALRSMPLETAMDAVRALEISMRQTRLIRGEPTERTALEVEDRMREEAKRWMKIERFEIFEDGTERRIEPTEPDPDDAEDAEEEA